jgi:hypothetical protein
LNANSRWQCSSRLFFALTGTIGGMSYDVENFKLPLWIITAQDGRSLSTFVGENQDEKQFVPVCDNEAAANVFMERNRRVFPGKVITKPVSSLAHMLRVLLDSQNNGCKYLGRIAESGSMKLLPLDQAIDALQGHPKSN